MSILLSTIIYGAIEILIESLGWGTSGYLLFRFWGWNERKWYIEIVILVSIFTCWKIWSDSYLSMLDITIGNKEVLKLLGSDANELFRTDIFDIALGIMQIFAGYYFGKTFLKSTECEK